MLEPDEQLKTITWELIGLSEIRRKGKVQISLKSGHLFHYRGSQDTSNGGIEFMIHRKHTQNIVQIDSVTSRVVYIVVF